VGLFCARGGPAPFDPIGVERHSGGRGHRAKWRSLNGSTRFRGAQVSSRTLAPLMASAGFFFAGDVGRVAAPVWAVLENAEAANRSVAESPASRRRGATGGVWHRSSGVRRDSGAAAGAISGAPGRTGLLLGGGLLMTPRIISRLEPGRALWHRMKLWGAAPRSTA
jgi:hypothetical protein